jgi:hypothetical protein
VAAVTGAVGDRDTVPGQAGAARQQQRLVGLDHKQVVGLLVAHQELGGLGVCVQRISGHHHTGQVQVGQQLGEGGDFLGGATDLALGQHRAAGMLHRRQQVHRTAVISRHLGAGAAQALAVDGNRPPPAGRPTGTLPVGQPGADHTGQHLGVQARHRPADGGLGRDREVAGGVVAGAERGPDLLGRIDGPFGDRGERPRPARTAAAAMARMVTSRWRRPRALLGSGTAAR